MCGFSDLFEYWIDGDRQNASREVEIREVEIRVVKIRVVKINALKNIIGKINAWQARHKHLRFSKPTGASAGVIWHGVCLVMMLNA